MEAAQGCEDPLRGTKASTEAEAQDVCHQLLDSPFRECHVQVWVGVEVVSTTREVGRMGASEVPNRESGPVIASYVRVISEVPSGAHSV